MKVAIVYNRNSDKVINLFGIPNQERIGLKTIKQIADGLKREGHQVKTFEGDKDLVEHLEDFMPRVVKGELPGLVFNVSYGIQGQARYTHVPSILEMVGIPYVGSGPLAHSLALDKVVAKMMFRQYDIPTPDFIVLDSPAFEMPSLPYPLIVKPKHEAVSFGIRIANNEVELREGARVIFQKYNQPVLVERYIEGRELNIGLLGNNPPETLPAVELLFGSVGPNIYTYEDKSHVSDRKIDRKCPADLSEELVAKAQDLALRTFKSLGCHDCARVDMRLDREGNLYVLEVNSLPNLGEGSSYTVAARVAGLDFGRLVCRLVEVASARYFGTPKPPKIIVRRTDLGQSIFSFLIERRDQIERRVREWTALSSRTADFPGLQEAQSKLGKSLVEILLRPVRELTDERYVWTWESRSGFEGGMLLIGHLDVPMGFDAPVQAFRRDPEWLYGEGVGVSRAPLVMTEFTLRALRSVRRLRKLPIGVLYYADEGRECRYSRDIIQAAAAKAKLVLVLRPGNIGNRMITQRRGWRKYHLVVEGSPRRLGKTYKKRGVLRWVSSKLDEMAKLSSRENRISIAVSDMKTEAYPRMLPHRVLVTMLLSSYDVQVANSIERSMRQILIDNEYRWKLELISDRPPMRKRKKNDQLMRSLMKVAEEWEIPLHHESSTYPSVAGLVPSSTAVVCGTGPVVRDMDTPHESVQRISLLQRTLLLAQFLVAQETK
jgi:D-alanine-D-alanine ligase